MVKTISMMQEELDYLYSLLDYLDGKTPCIGVLIKQLNDRFEEGNKFGRV